MKTFLKVAVAIIALLFLGVIFAHRLEDPDTSRGTVLEDEEVAYILEEFSGKNWWEDTIPYFAEKLPPTGKLLSAVLRSEKKDIKEEIEEAKSQLNNMEIADAPQARAFREASTQLCLAESIAYGDLKNTTKRCGYEPEFSFESADDLTAVAEVIPFFINGLAHYHEEQYDRAERYFEQIDLHRSLLEGLDYVVFTDPHFELYNKIYNKTPDREVLLKGESLEYGEERKEIEVFDFEENLIFRFSIEDLREWSEINFEDIFPESPRFVEDVEETEVTYEDFKTFDKTASLSPGGKKLAFSVHDYYTATYMSFVGIVDIKTKEVGLVGEEIEGEVEKLKWAPDKDYLAYSVGTARTRGEKLRVDNMDNLEKSFSFEAEDIFEAMDLEDEALRAHRFMPVFEDLRWEGEYLFFTAEHPKTGKDVQWSVRADGEELNIRDIEEQGV